MDPDPCEIDIRDEPCGFRRATYLMVVKSTEKEREFDPIQSDDRGQNVIGRRPSMANIDTDAQVERRVGRDDPLARQVERRGDIALRRGRRDDAVSRRTVDAPRLRGRPPPRLSSAKRQRDAEGD